MLLYLGIIVLFAILLGIFLWYTRVHKKSVWYNIKLLFKAYDAACQDFEIVKRGNLEFAICRKEMVHSIYVNQGFCNALHFMPTVDYNTKHAILDILGKEITIEDIYWKVKVEQLSEADLRCQLLYINSKGAIGMYWFYSGDILARRDLLYRVLKKHGKIK